MKPPTTLDMLKVDLKHVKTKITDFPSVKPPLYDGVQMYVLLNTFKKGHRCDVITYTASPHADLDLPVDRLIYCLGSHRATAKKKFSDIHTKMFIVKNEHGYPVCVFIGSQNLVAPTSHNLSYHITAPAEIAQCVAYFEHLWKQ